LNGCMHGGKGLPEIESEARARWVGPPAGSVKKFWAGIVYYHI
jgi:hypothetical protein